MRKVNRNSHGIGKMDREDRAEVIAVAKSSGRFPSAGPGLTSALFAGYDVKSAVSGNSVNGPRDHKPGDSNYYGPGLTPAVAPHFPTLLPLPRISKLCVRR